MLLIQEIKSIKRVDSMIGRLYEGLKNRSLDEKVNIIMVSDHGRIYDVLHCIVLFVMYCTIGIWDYYLHG